MIGLNPRAPVDGIGRELQAGIARSLFGAGSILLRQAANDQNRNGEGKAAT